MLTLQSHESIRARVMQMASEACGDEACPIQAELKRCVDAAVMAHRDSGIKAFVPLLAWRDVEGCIRVGHCFSQSGATTA